MRAGTFPRSRVVGGKSMWRSDEIDAWLVALQVRPQGRRFRGGDVNAAPQSAKVARANSALRDLRRADQSREGASPSWHIPYTA